MINLSYIFLLKIMAEPETMTVQVDNSDKFPLLEDKSLPVNRENLGLPQRKELNEVPLEKGRIEDYKFDLERQQALKKEEVTKEHTQYLEGHPELKQLVSDMLTSLLMDKPSDVY